MKNIYNHQNKVRNLLHSNDNHRMRSWEDRVTDIQASISSTFDNTPQHAKIWDEAVLNS